MLQYEEARKRIFGDESDSSPTTTTNNMLTQQHDEHSKEVANNDGKKNEIIHNNNMTNDDDDEKHNTSIENNTKTTVNFRDIQDDIHDPDFIRTPTLQQQQRQAAIHAYNQMLYQMQFAPPTQHQPYNNLQPPPPQHHHHHVQMQYAPPPPPHHHMMHMPPPQHMMYSHQADDKFPQGSCRPPPPGPTVAKIYRRSKYRSKKS